MEASKIIYYRAKPVEIIHTTQYDFCYPMHNHSNTYTVGIVLFGELSILRKNAAETYKQDSFYVISPYEAHAVNQTSFCKTLTFCIQKTYIDNTSCDTLMSILLQEEWPHKPSLSVIEQAVELLYCCKNNFCDLENAFITDVTNRIESHSEYSISLDTLSGSLSISKYYFVRRFKKAVGLTPHKFLLQTRIRKAQQLLDSQTALTDIAYLCSFYDQSHFIKSFKYFVGLSPKEYRKQCRILPRPNTMQA